MQVFPWPGGHSAKLSKEELLVRNAKRCAIANQLHLLPAEAALIQGTKPLDRLRRWKSIRGLARDTLTGALKDTNPSAESWCARLSILRWPALRASSSC